MSQALKTAPGGVVTKVALLDFRDGGVVFAQSREEVAYTLGGKPEPGESLESALVREVREEAGVELARETVKHLQFFRGPCHGYAPGTELHMHCYTAEYEGAFAVQEGDTVFRFVTLRGRDIGTGKTTEMGDRILSWLLMQRRIEQ